MKYYNLLLSTNRDKELLQAIVYHNESNIAKNYYQGSGSDTIHCLSSGIK